jgi:hypothetical protein
MHIASVRRGARRGRASLGCWAVRGLTAPGATLSPSCRPSEALDTRAVRFDRQYVMLAAIVRVQEALVRTGSAEDARRGTSETHSSLCACT